MFAGKEEETYCSGAEGGDKTSTVEEDQMCHYLAKPRKDSIKRFVVTNSYCRFLGMAVFLFCET